MRGKLDFSPLCEAQDGVSKKNNNLNKSIIGEVAITVTIVITILYSLSIIVINKGCKLDSLS